MSPTQEAHQETTQETSDIPADFDPRVATDYERREVMIPMRDGVKLYTAIVVPRGAHRAPMLLDRTPYAAAKGTRLNGSTHSAMMLHRFHGELSEAGYITVLQDVRGKHKSEGVYVMSRPLRGEFNTTPTDHATDTWDTIEWLVHNVPECNGRVGTIGISYDGFTVLMSLVDPHPALKAAVPINPMVDGWMGDDWFHNGAFRQWLTLPYIWVQTATKGSELPWPVSRYDEYESWMEAGSAGAMGRALGMEQLPFWQRLTEHPAYDRFWSEQAMDRILAARPHTVHTLHVHSQWDSEDIVGAMSVYKALQPQGQSGASNRLVIGPWSHGGVGFADGSSLGPVHFGSDTARWFRRELLLGFLDAHLRDDGLLPALAPVTAFESGSNVWREYDAWPPAPGRAPHRLYLAANHSLSQDPPAAAAGPAFDGYVSDPAKPVTHTPRPIRPKGGAGSNWDAWLVEDQRFAADRPDVLVYCSPVLTQAVRVAGQPVMHLHASTSGTDADWIIKLIDVYPDEVPGDVTMGGYQLPVAMEVLRARYREDPSKPKPVPRDTVVPYRIALPHVSHAFLPGHRIMVQVQSSWFPLYDRNPQTFVPNIFFAQPQDYVKAMQRVHRAADAASCIELPLAP
jgi:putative CocE/NonD family hydrolase